METFVANETEENAWPVYRQVDLITSWIQIQPPLFVIETSYDPCGLELTGLGYIYGGLHTNRCLYQGKELIDDTIRWGEKKLN